MRRLRRARKALFNNLESSLAAEPADSVRSLSSLKAYEIAPQLTDRAITHWLAPHYVVVPPPAVQRNQLFLFLAGSYGKPVNQQLILQEAAQLGYHAINLCYPNSWIVGSLCRRSPDSDCHAKVRLEILDGVKRSNHVDIGRANSLENRLVKLLHYLREQQPTGEWSAYLDGDCPKWDAIAVAGHSQGGGHAAMIAKTHVVERVIMLGAPADYSPLLKAPAPWLSPPHATPPDRYYGFAHLQDKAIKRILLAWQLLGMAQFGEPVNVDEVPSPYRQTHQLVTMATPAHRDKHHGSVAVDAQTPKQLDGTPLFKSVWQYLLG